MLRVVQLGDEEREVRSALDARELHRACARGGLRRGLVEWGRRGGGASPRFFDILGAGSTFTRASEASYYTQPPTDDEGDVAGKAFLAWAVANTPRMDARDGVPMLLFEGARTNYHTTSRDLGSYTIGVAPTITTNTDGAPDGDASSVRAECPLDDYYYKSTSALTTGQPYIISQWLRGVSGQTLPMVTRYSPGPDGASIVGQPPTTTWRREKVQRTPTGTALNGYVNDGRNTSGIGGLVAGARDGMMAMPQVEGGSAATGQFATSFIRTTGVIATRATDRLSFAGGAWPRSMVTGGVEVVFRPIPSSAEIAAGSTTMYLFSFKSGSTERVSFVGTGGNVFFSVSANNVSVISQIVTWAAGAELRVVLRPDANTATLSGFLTGNGTYTSGATWASFWQASYDANDNLHIGTSVTGVNAMFGRFAQRWRLP